MHDLPTSMLTQQAAAKARTGEELEAFGKRAAALYGAGQGSLSSSVVSTVKHAGLSPEQVRRVVEFANHSAYQAEFQKESSAHKVVSFQGGPADPGVVLQDLNDGGGGTVFDSGLGDYRVAPSTLLKSAGVLEKNERRLGLEDAKLAAAFGITEEALLPSADPYRPALDARSKLAGLYETAVLDLSGEEAVYLDVCDALAYEVKTAAARGTSLSQIVTAWGEVGADPVFVKAAFEMLSPRLISAGVFPSRTAMAESLSEKVASVGLVNLEHPLVLVYRDFCGSLTKMASLRAYSEECAQGVERLDSFLKEATAASALGEGLGVVARQVPKAWGAVTNATARLAQPAEAFAREVATSGGASKETADAIASALGGAVKYSPHAAAALVAEDTYQHAKNSPALNGAGNFVMSRVPFTQPYLMRQYAIQQGMM